VNAYCDRTGITNCCVAGPISTAQTGDDGPPPARRCAPRLHRRV